MSEAVTEVTQEVAKVVEEVKEFVVLEKAHVVDFLNFLAKQPYGNVFDLIEKIKTGTLIKSGPTPAAPAAAPVEVTPSAEAPVAVETPTQS